MVNALACYSSTVVVDSQFPRERVFESHRCRVIFGFLRAQYPFLGIHPETKFRRGAGLFQMRYPASGLDLICVRYGRGSVFLILAISDDVSALDIHF